MRYTACVNAAHARGMATTDASLIKFQSTLLIETSSRLIIILMRGRLKNMIDIR